MQSHGINTVYPVVWNDARTNFPSKVSKAYLGYSIDPRLEGRDPLQELIDLCKPAGIRVIPWFEYGFACSYQKDGGSILERYPHWAARDRDGNLLTKNGFEWMNAYHPEVQTFIKALVLECVENYDIEGIQGDDRLPAQPSEGGYSEYTRTLYRDGHGGRSVPDDPRDPGFMRWKADQLNAFAKDIYAAVKRVKPDLVVSWAPSVYPWSYDEYLQDWPNWIKGGYADEVIPQVYRYDFNFYQQTLESLAADSLGLSPQQHALILPGILMNVGDYLIPQDYLAKIIDLNREMGYHGEVFFFYEGLRKDDDRLGRFVAETYQLTD
jgi:uncharacterized lipoprotein YddW (UPF0748 family)